MGKAVNHLFDEVRTTSSEAKQQQVNQRGIWSIILRRGDEERARNDVIIADNEQNRRKEIDVGNVIGIIRAAMTAESEISSQGLNRL